MLPHFTTLLLAALLPALALAAKDSQGEFCEKDTAKPLEDLLSKEGLKYPATWDPITEDTPEKIYCYSKDTCYYYKETQVMACIDEKTLGYRTINAEVGSLKGASGGSSASASAKTSVRLRATMSATTAGAAASATPTGAAAVNGWSKAGLGAAVVAGVGVLLA